MGTKRYQCEGCVDLKITDAEPCIIAVDWECGVPDSCRYDGESKKFELIKAEKVDEKSYAIDKLLKRIEALEAAVEAPKAESKPEDMAKLRLEVVGEDLFIEYGGSIIGHIAEDGRCHFMNTDDRRKIYREWQSAGMLADHTFVEWRGVDYFIDRGKILTSVKGDVYDFKYAVPKGGCHDNNIATYPISRTPIIA